MEFIGAKTEYFPAAIEIGSTAIKLLQMARTKSDYEISKLAYLPLDFGPGIAPNPVLIRSSLRKLIEDHHIKGEVVSCLPINHLQTFTYILPNMPEDEIKQAVAWKLKQNPPSGMTFEGLSFDYVASVQHKDKLSQNTRILVFVVSKETVKQQLKLFQEFSLELIALEPEPYAALGVLFWLGKLGSDETVLVIHLGASQSSITIVHSGQPHLVHPLSVCGNTFTEAIANYYQFDWQKAETMKKQEGLTALSSQLENLVIDIEHTFKYFSHQLMKSAVTTFKRVLLCGGSSSLPNSVTFLADRLTVPVEVVNPLSPANIYLKQELTPLVKENSASFTSALGLALKSLE